MAWVRGWRTLVIPGVPPFSWVAETAFGPDWPLPATYAAEVLCAAHGLTARAEPVFVLNTSMLARPEENTDTPATAPSP